MDQWHLLCRVLNRRAGAGQPHRPHLAEEDLFLLPRPRGPSSLGFATVTDGFWAAILFRTLGGVGLAEPMFFGVTLDLASPVGAAGSTTIASWG